MKYRHHDVIINEYLRISITMHEYQNEHIYFLEIL